MGARIYVDGIGPALFIRRVRHLEPAPSIICLKQVHYQYGMADGLVIYAVQPSLVHMEEADMKMSPIMSNMNESAGNVQIVEKIRFA